MRCVQRKPLTAEVLNFTKRPGEKVLTNYHRKSLFKDNVRWHQIHKDEYCLFYSSFSFYKNLGCCLYCCRWPTFPRKENDSRSEENISKRISVQLANLKILKLKLGSEAWGNKTKESYRGWGVNDEGWMTFQCHAMLTNVYCQLSLRVSSASSHSFDCISLKAVTNHSRFKQQKREWYLVEWGTRYLTFAQTILWCCYAYITLHVLTCIQNAVHLTCE